MVFRLKLICLLVLVQVNAEAQTFIDSCVSSQLAVLNAKLYNYAAIGLIPAYGVTNDSSWMANLYMTPEEIDAQSNYRERITYEENGWGFDTFITTRINPEKHFHGQRFQYRRKGDGFVLEYYAPVYTQQYPTDKDTTFFWLKWSEIQDVLDSSERIFLSGIANLAFRQYNYNNELRGNFQTEEVRIANYSRFLFANCIQADFTKFSDAFWDSLIHIELATHISEGLMGSLSCYASKGFLRGFKPLHGKKQRQHLAQQLMHANVVIHPQGNIHVFIHEKGEQWQLNFNWSDIKDDLMPLTRMLIEKYYFGWTHIPAR